LAVADFDEDGIPDFVTWSEEKGLSFHINQGNGNHGVQVLPTGHRHETKSRPMRCNADGVGVWVVAQTQEHWTGVESATLSAGRGQSRQPLLLGLGRHQQAQIVRLRWPDICWQAEFNIPSGPVMRIEEESRKPGSCPVLFTWNGQRFVFVTDFLGEGTV